MITVTVKHENDDRRNFGGGVYVNAYVQWQDDADSVPVLYASECVPFGKNTEKALKAAERRVRRNATRKAKREYVG